MKNLITTLAIVIMSLNVFSITNTVDYICPEKSQQFYIYVSCDGTHWNFYTVLIFKQGKNKISFTNPKLKGCLIKLIY